MAELSDKDFMDSWNKAGQQEMPDTEFMENWNRAGEPTSPQPSGLLRRGGDIAISAVKGAISLPEAFVGLANIPTMGLAGKAAKGLGVDFKGSREFLDTMLSPEQQQLNREVQETEGFFPTVGAMIQRPSTIGHAVIESAPSMIGAGAIGRGILKVAPKIGAVVGGAVGEGAISAGQTVEQVRQTMPTGLIDPGQTAIGVTSGAITGLFGVLGGKLARRLGTFDPETLLAGGRLNVVRNAGELEAKKSILRKIIEAAITEGAFEELPQSAQEQIAQNLMLGKPPEEGVANAAATGMLAGTVMGGGAGVAGHILAKTNPVIEQLKTDPLAVKTDELMTEVAGDDPDLKAVMDVPPAPAPGLGVAPPVAPPVAPVAPPVAPTVPVAEAVPASLATRFNNLPVVEAPVPQITLSSEIPQHKRGANTKGIITPLEGKEYQRTPMKTIILWERNDGRLEVVTGRHRLDLAQRLGEKTIPSQIVREADGFTAEMGVALDAEQNILDNQGDEYDFANYFRTAITETDAKDRGLLRTPKARTAFILAKSATDSTFDAFRDDAIGFEQAAAIAKSAPQNETLQLAGRNHVVKNPRISPFELENYVKVLSTFPPAPQAEQGDMFGYDDTAIRTAEMQAKKVVSIVNKMKADSQTINAAIRREGKLKLTPEAAAEYGITDPNDMNQLTAARIKILNELDMWANWDQHPELIARLKGEEIAPAAPVAAPTPEAAPEVAPVVPPTPEAAVAPVEQPIAPVAEVAPAAPIPEITPEVAPVAETKMLSRETAKLLLSLPAEQRAFPMGAHNAKFRQQIIKELTGQDVPQSKAGATAVRNALAGAAGIDRTKLAPVEVERHIQEWLERIVAPTVGGERIAPPAEAVPEAKVGPITTIKWDTSRGAIGVVPDQIELDYKGFSVPMTPASFRSLVPSGRTSEKTPGYVKESAAKGTPVAPPWLAVDWDENEKVWKVDSHEGRSRADVAAELAPNEPIPVSILLNGGLRARHLTPEMRAAKFIPQDGGEAIDPRTKVEPAPAPIVEPEPVVEGNRWANDLAALDQEVATKRETILRWSKNQAEADGWIDKWTPEKAIDEHYGKYVRGLGSASGIPLKQGETWRGRLVAMTKQAPSPLPEAGAAPEADYAKQATDLGIIFNDMQERVNKPPMPLFTDPKTGTTFTPKEGETVQQALERKRGEFAKPGEKAEGKQAWEMTAVEARRTFPTLTQEKWGDAVQAALDDGRLTENSAPFQSMYKAKPRDFGEIDAVINGRMSPSKELLERHPELAPVAEVSPTEEGIKPTKETYIGKVETAEIPEIPPPKAEPFGLTAPEGEVGKEGMVNREVTGELFGKAEAKAVTPEPKLPEGIQPYAGADGLVVVEPKMGDIIWQTSGETGKLEAIRYEGKTGQRFDQHEYDKWTWLTGPEKGTIDTGYGRSRYAPKTKPVPATEKTAPSEWLSYDPSTNRYNGEVLSRGDILEADAGGRYAVDRVNGFMLDLTRLDVAGKPSGTFSVSVDPMDKGRFAKLKKTGENIYKAEPTARRDELTPIQSYFENNVVPVLKDFFFTVDSMGRDRLIKSGVMPDENATKWLASVMRQESSWAKGGRKTGITGIQMLSQKGLWPTKGEEGENLRKSMLAAVQALRKAPGYSNDWVSNIEKGAYAFGETKMGDIHPDDTWGGYQEGLDGKARQTWKTKLEGFVNELQRTLQENRDSQVASDTSYLGEHEVSILRRLRDRRLFDEEVRGANQRNDRQRWQGVDISPAFTDTPEFKLAEQHFTSLGYQTVPVTRLPWGMAVNPNTKTVFMGEMSGDRFAYFMSHETSHILSAQGNASVLAIKAAIDLTNSSIVEQREGRGWTDDYTRDEFTASIVGGVVGNEAMLRGDQTANIKAAREAVASYTRDGDITPFPTAEGNRRWHIETDKGLKITWAKDEAEVRRKMQAKGFKIKKITEQPDTLKDRYGDIQPPSTNQPAPWLSPEDNWKATAFYKWFDRYNDLDASMKSIGEFLRNSGTILTDDQDPLLIVRQYKKKAADQERRFNSEEVEPQFKKLEEYNITQPEIDEYLWMRSAVSENKLLRERHKKNEAVREAKAVAAGKDFKPDLDFPADPAGVSDEKATAYMRNLNPQRKLQFEAVAKMYDAMIKETRAVAVAGKLETQETMDQWAKDHPLYAPYFREGKEKETSVYQGIGQGFTNIGSISKGRVGSELAVFHPFANGIMQRARVMRRVEKNKADIALSGLVKIAPNAGWWKPAVPRIREMTLADGTRADVVDDTYKYDENVIMARVPVKERVRIDGKMVDKWRIVERGVEFNKDNPRALRLARALKNLDMEDQALILSIAAKITRYISKVNTEWSPTFGPVNFTRDLGTMLMNLSTTPIAGKQKEVLKNIPGNLNAIYSELRARRQGGKSDHRLAAVYDQFQLDGGQMGLSEMFRSSNELAESIERRLAGGKSDKALRKAARLSVSATFNWLSDFNKTLENAVRLSVYMVGLDSGMTGPRAANMANEITVDFTKKGQVAQQANALFAFFTASAGGGLRAYQTVMGPKGKQIIMGGILFGMLQTALLAAWGFEDDEPPDFIKERNIIIPTGWKTYKTIPMPLVFNVLPNIGRIFMEGSIAGFKGKPVHPVEKLANLMGVIVEACNPLGGSGISLQTITPTPLDPLVALAENMDWNRKQISRPDFSSLSPTPGFTRAKDTASYIGMGLSWAFNMLTQGTQYTKGFFSPTPDQIDYLVGQASGGLGREIIKIQHIARAMRKGDEIPAYRIPLISRFHGSTEGQAQESTRFYNNLKLMNKHEDEITGRRDNRKPITEYLKDNPEARHFAMANRAESSIARLMKQKRALTERGASQSSIKVIDAAITSHMRRFNETIKKAKG